MPEGVEKSVGLVGNVASQEGAPGLGSEGGGSVGSTSVDRSSGMAQSPSAWHVVRA